VEHKVEEIRQEWIKYQGIVIMEMGEQEP